MHIIIKKVFESNEFANKIIKFLNEKIDKFSTLHWVIRNFVPIEGNEKTKFPFDFVQYIVPGQFLLQKEGKKYYSIIPIYSNNKEDVAMVESFLNWFHIPYKKTTSNFRKMDVEWCRRCEGYAKTLETAPNFVYGNKGVLILQEDYTWWGMLHFNVKYKNEIEKELTRLGFKFDIIMPS